VDRQEAIEFLLDHYQNPRNHGPLDPVDVTMPGGNPGCGDIVTYHLKVGGDGRVEELRFEGSGCTISQAAAELVAERAEGVSLSDIEGMSHDEIIDLLGREIVMSRPRCASLALGTLKETARMYRQGRRDVCAE